MSVKQVSPLRFAIMCNSYEFQQWQADCIKELLICKNIELVLLIINETSGISSKTFFQKIKTYPFRNLFYRIYKRYFLKPRSAQQISLKHELKNISSVLCKPVLRNKYSEYFSSEDIETIKKDDLDFIIRFGFNIVRGEILNVAKYGIWSYHHGDEQKYRGGPPGFWEIYENNNVSAVILQKLTNELDSGVILRKGFFRTIKHSYRDHVNMLFEQVNFTRWIEQVCSDIQNGEENYINNEPVQTKAPVYRAPNNFQMIIFIIRILLNKFSFHYRDLFYAEEWNIAIVEKPISAFLDQKEKIIPTWIKASRKEYYKADPFGFVNSGKLHILYEYYNYASGKGRIDLLICNTENHSDNFTALELNEHLSYPYIIEYENEIYCIPESYEARQVYLYRLDKESGQWKRKNTLLSNISAVDSSLFFHENRWWLFCTIKEFDSNVNLFAFYSSDFEGPYIEHSINPIKTDIRSSRPAGTPFYYEGNLYRPSQNSSSTYGGGVCINKITSLTPTAFREEVCSAIYPFNNSEYNRGIHTLSSAGDYTLIDGKRLVFSKYNFRRKLSEKFKRVLN